MLFDSQIILIWLEYLVWQNIQTHFGDLLHLLIAPIFYNFIPALQGMGPLNVS